MLAIASRLFLYKNIARLLLRNIADNLHRYKANFHWWFRTNLRLFTVREANNSHQFCYLIKKNVRMIFRVKRELIARRRMKKKPINIVHFLIFVDKSWFKVTNLFVFLFMCIFKWGLAANKCYESSKLTEKLVDSVK